MKTFAMKYIGHQPIDGSPGQLVRIYGHKFIIQDDGKKTCICEMPEEARAAIESEIKHGRPYKILSDKAVAKAATAAKEDAK